MKRYPSQEDIKKIFKASPLGDLVWADGKRKGLIAGHVTIEYTYTARRRLYMLGSAYKYSDILWIYFNGDIPEGFFVKQKCGPFEMPKITDLFLAKSKNMKHCGNVSTDNKHGYKGIRQQESGSFQALLDGQDLGTYSTPEAAATAWDLAAEEKYGKGLIKNDSGCLDPENYRITLSASKHNTRHSKHKYRGVMPNHENWMARIRKNGKPKYLGTFKTQEEAARAYNKAAYEIHGDNAALNDIPDPLGTGAPF